MAGKAKAELAPAANGNVASAVALAKAGVQKWHFNGTTWSMFYPCSRV
jgi:hypothetical protein